MRGYEILATKNGDNFEEADSWLSASNFAMFNYSD